MIKAYLDLFSFAPEPIDFILGWAVLSGISALMWIITWFYGTLVTAWERQQEIEPRHLSLSRRIEMMGPDFVPIAFACVVPVGILITIGVMLWITWKIPKKIIYEVFNKDDSCLSTSRIASTLNRILIRKGSN